MPRETNLHLDGSKLFLVVMSTSDFQESSQLFRMRLGFFFQCEIIERSSISTQLKELHQSRKEEERHYFLRDYPLCIRHYFGGLCILYFIMSQKLCVQGLSTPILQMKAWGWEKTRDSFSITLLNPRQDWYLDPGLSDTTATSLFWFDQKLIFYLQRYRTRMFLLPPDNSMRSLKAWALVPDYL